VLPLLHAMPFGAFGFVQVPSALHTPLVWHWSIAVHVPGSVPVQTPLEHVYFKQLFDPLQEIPSCALGLLHCPVVMSHAPATWQPSLAVQTTEGVPLHIPPAQA
jgi:hypothetical protein